MKNEQQAPSQAQAGQHRQISTIRLMRFAIRQTRDDLRARQMMSDVEFEEALRSYAFARALEEKLSTVLTSSAVMLTTAFYRGRMRAAQRDALTQPTLPLAA